MMCVQKKNYCSLAPPSPIPVCYVTIPTQMSIFFTLPQGILFFQGEIFFFIHQSKEEVISFNLNRRAYVSRDFRFWKIWIAIDPFSIFIAWGHIQIFYFLLPEGISKFFIFHCLRAFSNFLTFIAWGHF